MFIQIDGLSGTGKTTIAGELAKRGYTTFDADEAFGYWGDPETGEPTETHHQLNWIWDLDKIRTLASESADKTVFICGGSMNQNKIKDVFDYRFTLVVDDKTLKHRLLTRTNSDFGKEPEDLARQLEWNQGIVGYAESIGSVVIDATKPINTVADDILTRIAA